MARPVLEDGEYLWVITPEEVVRKGHEDGVKLVPPSDAAGPGAYEQHLTSTTESEFARKKKPLLEKARKLADEIKTTTVALDGLDNKSLGFSPIEHLESNLRADAEQARPDGVRRFVSQLRAEAYLNHFKDQNGLLRPADKVKTLPDAFAMILLFLLIETVLNAWFYSAGVGLLAGAIFALAFSLVTALIGYCTGFFGRYRNAKTLLEKLFGWVVLFLGAAAAVYLSTVTATFRALMEVARNQDSALGSSLSTTLFPEAMAHGFDVFFFHVPFRELNAVILFCISIAAFINAVFVGYTRYDPVPNYTKHSERVNEDANEVNSAIRRLRDALITEADRMKNERLAIIAEAKGLATTGGRLVNQADDYSSKYRNLEKAINKTHATYMALYRDENARMRARATPSPEYFSSEVEFVPLCDAADLDFLSQLQVDASSLETRARDLASKVGSFNDDIQHINNSRASLAQLVTQLTDEWRADAVKAIDSEGWAGPRKPSA
jgi:multisubunit Na+/H+ antiporter MnhB subunit